MLDKQQLQLPPLLTFLLTMTSKEELLLDNRLSIALSLAHKLLVLNTLNFLMDLNSSTWSLETWGMEQHVAQGQLVIGVRGNL